ncbi:MAG: leucyl aminopeptidase, partial [Thermoanaerobaculia bacterium]
IGSGTVRGRLLVVGCFEGEKPEAAALPEALARAAVTARRGGARWEGGLGKRLRAGGAAEVGRLVLLGLGARDELDGDRLERWIDAAVSEAEDGGDPELLLALPDVPLLAGEAACLRVLRRLALSAYRFDALRGEPDPALLHKVRLLAPESCRGALRRARRHLAAVVDGTVLARDLANTPPNVATPEWMAGRARDLARARGLEVEILGPRQLSSRGMAGILAVGGGSGHAPRMVRLAIPGDGPTVSLVGKGVTFDTGGISIKPSAAMDEMKYDKCGACAVLGAVQAVADLGLPVRLEAYVALAENMPDGAAYRPGDILRYADGQSVEVLNTDAEGRLILADALLWAGAGKPDSLVELSTLTGATVVALGHHGAALYSPDDGLAGELLAAAGTSGDRLWRMPLWPEFREALRGTHGDLKNVAGRWGGGNTAAAFLASFMGTSRRWAHLDIAGTAWIGPEGKGRPGATGFGVGLLLDWLMARAGAA